MVAHSGIIANIGQFLFLTQNQSWQHTPGSNESPITRYFPLTSIEQSISILYHDENRCCSPKRTYYFKNLSLSVVSDTIKCNMSPRSFGGGLKRRRNTIPRLSDRPPRLETKMQLRKRRIATPHEPKQTCRGRGLRCCCRRQQGDTMIFSMRVSRRGIGVRNALCPPLPSLSLPSKWLHDLHHHGSLTVDIAVHEPHFGVIDKEGEHLRQL